MKKKPSPLMLIGLLLGWIIVLSCLGISGYRLYRSLSMDNMDIATMYYMAVLLFLRALLQLFLFTDSKWKEIKNA